MGKTRNTLKLNTSGFESMLKKLDALGGDVKKAAEEALQTAAEKIAQDTKAAISPQNLPARGKYSTGLTEKSIISDPQVTWDGLTGWVPVGFDFNLPGAGGYLITGTPKMRPDAELHKMYKQKKYMIEIQDKMSKIVMDHVIAQMEK